MNDLVEFLLARLYEDRFAAYRELGRHDVVLLGAFSPVRVLAEVEAKRQIVDLWREAAEGLDEDEIAFVMSMSEYPSGVLTVLSATLRRLALPYADHKDFREEWRP